MSIEKSHSLQQCLLTFFGKQSVNGYCTRKKAKEAYLANKRAGVSQKATNWGQREPSD
jgi:hypothetical protein